MSLSKDLIKRIKTALKTKGMTYRSLAQSLGVAESTVKRWLSNNNLSLDQLDQICSILQLQLQDFVPKQKEQLTINCFNQSQELALAKNEKLLVAFYLCASKHTYKQILKKYEFSPEELTALLIKLDHLELIELHPENKIIPLEHIGTWWLPTGPLSKKYYAEIKRDFMNTTFTHDREHQWFFSGPLSNESLILIRRKIDQLAQEIKSFYEQDQNEDMKKSISLFCGYRPWELPIKRKYRRPR